MKELQRQGMSIQAISKLTGWDRKTIRKYMLAAGVVPEYGARTEQPSKLDAFKPYLEERLRAGVWNARVLLRELRERNFTGGYTILTDWLRPQRRSARTALPSSALGKASNYTLALWPKLTRFLEHPELELSNNLAENSMRPVALGRKNWIHIDCQQAGPKVAAILSVVEPCRRIGVQSAITLRLSFLDSTTRLAQLTPTAWSAHNL